MKTKNQLLKEGWIFTTTYGGRINATKANGASLDDQYKVTALTMRTIRKRIAGF